MDGLERPWRDQVSGNGDDDIIADGGDQNDDPDMVSEGNCPQYTMDRRKDPKTLPSVQHQGVRRTSTW